MDSSSFKGRVVGFETRVDGAWKQFRVDIDDEGLHINVKVGKGQGMLANERINFPGDLEDTLRLLKRFD